MDKVRRAALVAATAALTATPPAFRRLHLAGSVAGAHLEGSRPGLATAHRVARRMAPIHRHEKLGYGHHHVLCETRHLRRAQGPVRAAPREKYRAALGSPREARDPRAAE